VLRRGKRLPERERLPRRRRELLERRLSEGDLRTLNLWDRDLLEVKLLLILLDLNRLEDRECLELEQLLE
jgi:hypothetical protein